MEINIKSVHFDASQRLQDHIQKKLDRMSRRYDPAARAEVTLKVVKPETAMNKEVALKVVIAGLGEQFASKTANTFEEAFDTAIEAIDRQLDKAKHQKE
jgi:putative sigma-54 modulation protein